MGEQKTVDIVLPNGKLMMAQIQQMEPATSSGPKDVGLDRLLSFDAVTDSLQGVGAAIVESMERVKPSKATVEFGLELALKGGSLVSVFVAAGSKASLKVTLEWESGTRNVSDQTPTD